jgi:hypothetical protein
MGSAITAVRAADGGPGILDGSAAQEAFDNNHVAGHCTGVGPSSSLESSNPEAFGTSSPQGDTQSTQEEVVLPHLWLRLSEKDRACFGGCFSRMVLRVLRCQADGAEGAES